MYRVSEPSGSSLQPLDFVDSELTGADRMTAPVQTPAREIALEPQPSLTTIHVTENTILCHSPSLPSVPSHCLTRELSAED